MECIIKGGTIVTASDIFKADILIRNGKIHGISSHIDIDNDKEIKTVIAEDCYVMPGGIDAHVHIEYPLKGFYSADDFYSATMAAAHGGTTTVICMLPPPQAVSICENIEEWKRKAEGKAVVDYCFNQTVNKIDSETINEISTLIHQGHPSFKAFLSTENAISDYEILKLMEVIRQDKGQLLINCGNAGIERYSTEKLSFQDKGNIQNYHLNRPEINEIEGVCRAIRLASIAEIPIYIVHVSSYNAVEEIEHGRNMGVSIVAETCPQYLLLSNEKYSLTSNEGIKFTLNPPLRDPANLELLWKVLGKEGIQTVASDHCPFNYRGEKDSTPNDFTAIPNGLPGIETRLILMFNEGVMKGNISLNQFVEINSTNVAKYFGLYPRKGTIEVGSDADIVIINSKGCGTISQNKLYNKVDYSPYEGYKYCGTVKATIVRGNIIFEDDQFCGEAGYGKFVPRFIEGS